MADEYIPASPDPMPAFPNTPHVIVYRGYAWFWAGDRWLAATPAHARETFGTFASRFGAAFLGASLAMLMIGWILLQYLDAYVHSLACQAFGCS